jgi:hypothetical protein
MLAQADGSGGVDATSPLLQYGAIGVITVLLIAFARTAYQRETKRADSLDEELRRLNADMRERLVPLMTDVVRVLAEVNALQRDRRERS